jgi:hypothetical protein
MLVLDVHPTLLPRKYRTGVPPSRLASVITRLRRAEIPSLKMRAKTATLYWIWNTLSDGAILSPPHFFAVTLLFPNTAKPPWALGTSGVADEMRLVYVI